MARKPKVVITDYDYGNLDIELPILKSAGARVIALQAKSEEDLFEEARDCDAIMNQYARVGAATIDRMERCRVIARYGVGVDIVDVEAATRKGILVTNVRDYCTDEVADHAIALWLTLARKLFRYDAAIRNGVWRWQTGQPLYRLKGHTMGIVSFGKIGQAIAERAKAHSEIKPAFPAKVVGQAVTVQLSPGDLVDPLRAIEMSGPGDVIVVDAGGDRQTSVCGGLMGGLARNRGIRAMIIDGAGRDIDELQDMRWPIWTRAITARGTHTMYSGRKEELAVNVPIQCGGVTVNPGDFIVADTIGVTVIALQRAEEVLEAAREQAEREQKTRERVAQGKSLDDLLKEFGRL